MKPKMDLFLQASEIFTDVLSLLKKTEGRPYLLDRVYFNADGMNFLHYTNSPYQNKNLYKNKAFKRLIELHKTHQNDAQVVLSFCNFFIPFGIDQEDALYIKSKSPSKTLDDLISSVGLNRDLFSFINGINHNLSHPQLLSSLYNSFSNSEHAPSTWKNNYDTAIHDFASFHRLDLNDIEHIKDFFYIPENISTMYQNRYDYIAQQSLLPLLDIHIQKHKLLSTAIHSTDSPPQKTYAL